MCRKLLLLIAVLGLVGTVWADDPCVPDWRGLPGTTYAEFLYNGPPPTGDSGWPIYAPESDWYVPHPEKGDPMNFVERAYADGWLWDGPHWNGDYGFWQEPYDLPESHYETHALQLWTGDPVWQPTYDGRTGVLTNYTMGSWDIYNFWSTQPAKIFQIQVTWTPMDPFAPTPVFNAEMEYFTLEELRWEDPWWEPGGEYGWWESAMAWDGATWVEDTWWELDVWEGWWAGGWVGGEEPVWNIIEWWDEPLLPDYEIAAGGDWITSVFIIEMYPNPVKEFFGLFSEETPIAIDQVVIDTICIPEPTTIALLGLGGLALIRRRKR